MTEDNPDVFDTLRFSNLKFSIPNLILWLTGCFLVIGFALWSVWLATDNEAWIRYFFDYASALFFVGMGGAEFYLSLLCCLQFSSGEVLRRAWQFIVMGSACRFAGLIIAHLYGIHSYLNPDVWLRNLDSKQTLSLRRLGLAVSGPVSMILLAAGLFHVLRVYRRLGLAPRLKKVDHVLLVLVFSFTLCQGFDVLHSLSGMHESATIYHVLNWVTDPLLSLLLLEAVLIRRYVTHMGPGLIARCWGAYTKAIFATSLGSMSMWAISHEIIPWPLNSVTWYIWFVVSAAFALGPAYQVEAFRRAQERASPNPQTLSLSSPKPTIGVSAT